MSASCSWAGMLRAAAEPANQAVFRMVLRSILWYEMWNVGFWWYEVE